MIGNPLKHSFLFFRNRKIWCRMFLIFCSDYIFLFQANPFGPVQNVVPRCSISIPALTFIWTLFLPRLIYWLQFTASKGLEIVNLSQKLVCKYYMHLCIPFGMFQKIQISSSLSINNSQIDILEWSSKLKIKNSIKLHRFY